MNGALADELQEAFLVEREKVEKLEAEVARLKGYEKTMPVAEASCEEWRVKAFDQRVRAEHAEAEVERLKKLAEALSLQRDDADRSRERDRARVATVEAEVEALRESLRWYVRNDPMFGYLDRGVGTETPDGVQRLAARAALAGPKAPG